MARPPRQRPGAWTPLLWLLLAGPATCAASPADDGAGPGGRGPRGRARGDAVANEAVSRHDSSYGTFAGEFYDLRYLAEEGEAAGGWGGRCGTPAAAEQGWRRRCGKDANWRQLWDSPRRDGERTTQTPAGLQVGAEAPALAARFAGREREVVRCPARLRTGGA